MADDVFNLMEPFWLFEVDQAALSRMPEPRLGNWDIFVGALNTEAVQGVTYGAIREFPDGPTEVGQPRDRPLRLRLRDGSSSGLRTRPSNVLIPNKYGRLSCR